MSSIFDQKDIKYNKDFVTQSLFFIQQNKTKNFEDEKNRILKKIDYLKNKTNSDLAIKKIYLKLNEFAKKDKKINNLKWDVFYMMKKIILKNINNYQKLCRNSPLGSNFNCNDELESECFLVFENCIYKFNSNDGKNDFYFYFNKSLSRCLYKIFLRNIKDLDIVSSASSFLDFSNEDSHVFDKFLKNSQNELSIDFIVSNFNLDEDCISIILSKLKGERMSEFIKDNENINQRIYDKNLKKIKKQFFNEKNINFKEQLKVLKKYVDLEKIITEDNSEKKEKLSDSEYYQYYTEIIKKEFNNGLQK
jgi:hypothetical protein